MECDNKQVANQKVPPLKLKFFFKAHNDTPQIIQFALLAKMSLLIVPTLHSYTQATKSCLCTFKHSGPD